MGLFGILALMLLLDHELNEKLMQGVICIIIPKMMTNGMIPATTS